jgi:SpoVK/Ycf46/Vps4 family AAA+-type ATPase
MCLMRNLSMSLVYHFFTVIRPRLPADFLGPSVGAFEDSLLSLFSHIESMTKLKKCILILDNIEHILGPEYADSNGGNKSKIGLGSTRRDHLSFRIKNVFLAVMDRMRRSEQHSHSSERKGLLVICTSRSHDDGIVDRFDKVFHLDNPSSIERRYLIELGLGLILSIVPIEGWDGRVTEVVSATVGKSRGDIAQFCREAIESVPQITSEHTYMSRLDAMRNSLQSILPESVRNTSADGMVEMRVSSAKELRQKVRLDDNGNTVFPLLGENMLESWKQLESIIIAPLCRRDSLDVLLYGNAKNSQTLSQRKATSSGVLVSGDPGVGKTALAYHCAAVAAGFNPAIRLLEVSCTSLIHKEVGGSERSLHKLFEAARAAAPCILLLDGIETIAPVRGKDNTTEGTMDRLLSTLLTEMDGVASGGQSTSDKESSNSIGVIGITHNPPSWIDPALLRPGRLEKCIKLEKPDNTARKAIFLNAISGAEIDFSGAGFFDPKDYSQLADAVTMKTPGRSAAEIIALFDNAKMLALKEILADANGGREEYTNISISFRHFLGRG